ncbi:MAG: hypothetical protein E7081_08325 [Bacteroidales bacterium]|nr:hypothetical protein [Bacteroidales bacterium]
MFMRKIIIILLIIASLHATIQADTFSEIAKKYELSVDGKKYVVSGFTPFASATDNDIFANTMLWIINNVCPQLRDGITDVDVNKYRFSVDMALGSMPGSGLENIYYCTATFSVVQGRLVYSIHDIKVESKSVVFKKITPFEKLNPAKKETHNETMDDFVSSVSSTLNTMFDFVNEYKPRVSHWKEIGYRKPVVGLTEDECRIAFGKPKNIFENNGIVQWSYNTYFSLFFENGKVCSILN